MAGEERSRVGRTMVALESNEEDVKWMLKEEVMDVSQLMEQGLWWSQDDLVSRYEKFYFEKMYRVLEMENVCFLEMVSTCFVKMESAYF